MPFQTINNWIMDKKGTYDVIRSNVDRMAPVFQPSLSIAGRMVGGVLGVMTLLLLERLSQVVLFQTRRSSKFKSRLKRSTSWMRER